MSQKDLQNTSNSQFCPEYGSDDNGIAYSCGHINPLQKTMKNNIALSLQDIKKLSLEIAKISRNIIKEAIEFAEIRCEDIRSINSELRESLDNANDYTDYECSQCDEYSYDIDNLKEKLETTKKELEEANDKIKDLQDKLANLETV